MAHGRRKGYGKPPDNGTLKKAKDKTNMTASEKTPGPAGKKSSSQHPGQMEKGEGEKKEKRKAQEEATETALLRKALQEKTEEAASHYEQLLRLRAEFENTKKRQAKEQAQYLRHANEGLIKSLLPVIKNLERANLHAKENKDGESLREGVEMILNQFHEVLKKQGVEPVESLGQTFDPAKHEVISCVETEKHEENTVMEEFEKGYYLHGRLLCPSKVIVSKKPSRDGQEPPENPAARPQGA